MEELFLDFKFGDILRDNARFCSFEDYKNKYLRGKKLPERNTLIKRKENWKREGLSEVEIINREYDEIEENCRRYKIRDDIDYQKGNELGFSKQQLNKLCYGGTEYIAKTILEHPTDIYFIMNIVRSHNGKFEYKEVLDCISQYSKDIRNETEIDYKYEQFIDQITQIISSMEFADIALSKTRDTVEEQYKKKELGFNIEISKDFENMENMLDNNLRKD